MKLRIAFKRAESKRLRRRRSGPLICASCRSNMPRGVTFEIDGDYICRICYMRAKGKLGYCPRCRREKPIGPEFFYRKIRGRGRMSICRLCKDRVLLRRDERLCAGCWEGVHLLSFSPTQRSLPSTMIAMCIECEEKVEDGATTLGQGQAVRADSDECSPIGPRDKRCPRCKESKPIDEFYWAGSRVSSYCKPCAREYNSAQYHKRCSSSRYASRADASVYHLQKTYQEQELVDLWASGEVPVAPSEVEVPRETFKKERSTSYQKFLVGYERSLSLRSGPEEADDGHKNKAKAQDPPTGSAVPKAKERRAEVCARLRRPKR